MVGLRPAGGGRPADADLWYEINPSAGAGRFSGKAFIPNRNRDGTPQWWSNRDGILAFGGLVHEYRGRTWPDPQWQYRPQTIAHEFGHSLGLHHGASSGIQPRVSKWRGGNAYQGHYVGGFRGSLGVQPYGTIMAIGAGATFRRFSEDGESMYGRTIGDGSSNAVTVLRANVPYLADRARSRATTRDYGCFPGQCIDRAGRFRLSFFRFGDSNEIAHRLPAPVGPNAALYYFFDPANPEVLLKVLNGCGINGHWWVYGSAATDLPYRFYLRDLATGRRVTYQHQNGVVTSSNGFSGRGVITDWQAFRCGP